MVNWHKRFMDLTEYVAQWSKDRSTKVGCLIVRPDNSNWVTGYNGFPRGVDDDLEYRHVRPEKYLWAEHAERNAVYNCARSGIATEGCRIYVPWFPCMDCARAIVQSGINQVIYQKLDPENSLWLRWKDSCETALALFLETNIDLLAYDPITEVCTQTYWNVKAADSLVLTRKGDL
jgi:dCMP deaminase